MPRSSTAPPPSSSGTEQLVREAVQHDRRAAGSKILRTTKKGMSQRHPSLAEVEQMMSINEQSSAFITAAYCRDLGLLRRIDATALGVSSPTIQSPKT